MLYETSLMLCETFGGKWLPQDGLSNNYSLDNKSHFTTWQSQVASYIRVLNWWMCLIS